MTRRPGPARPARGSIDERAVIEGGKLEARDYQMLALLAAVRVATSVQFTRAFFPPSGRRARERLRELSEREVLARFRPPWQRPGCGPFMYCLGPLGAALAAAGAPQEAPIPKPGDVARQVLRLQQSKTLVHSLGVTDFVTHLLASARRIPGAELIDWRPETTAARHCGGIVRPDGYGQWLDPGPSPRAVGFFFEHDTGSEQLATLVEKIDRYAEVFAAGIIPAPVLFELPNPTRERNLHTELTRRHGPHGPAAVRVATTTRNLVASRTGPPGAIWSPVGTTGLRVRLAQLTGPHTPPGLWSVTP